jgi:hypothetical protein
MDIAFGDPEKIRYIDQSQAVRTFATSPFGRGPGYVTGPCGSRRASDRLILRDCSLAVERSPVLGASLQVSTYHVYFQPIALVLPNYAVDDMASRGSCNSRRLHRGLRRDGAPFIRFNVKILPGVQNCYRAVFYPHFCMSPCSSGHLIPFGSRALGRSIVSSPPDRHTFRAPGPFGLRARLGSVLSQRDVHRIHAIGTPLHLRQ